MSKVLLNFQSPSREIYIYSPQVSVRPVVAIIAVSLMGVLLHFVLNSVLFLILALLLNVIVVVYWFYGEKNYRNLSSDLLHQLAIEILDTGVILFDMHNRTMSCGVWTPKDARTLSCKIYSTNTKYEALKISDLPIDEQHAISVAIRERAQTFENAKVKVSSEGTVTKLEPQWDWRLVTPIVDAIDRLLVIGLLVIEGKGFCKVEELSNLGLDKAAAMLAFQICEVLSIMRRAS